MGENLYRVSNMTNTPKAYPGETAQGPTSSVDEAQLLYDIIRERVHFPDDVRRVEFRLGEDSTGAPAVWVAFVAHDDLKPSKIKIANLQRAANEVRSIIHNESNRWPYIEIVTE
jgi:hypothetical protein